MSRTPTQYRVEERQHADDTLVWRSADFRDRDLALTVHRRLVAFVGPRSDLYGPHGANRLVVLAVA